MSASIIDQLLVVARAAAEAMRRTTTTDFGNEVVQRDDAIELVAALDALPQDLLNAAQPESDECTWCNGLGEVQGQGSYADFEPPINKCSQCLGTGKTA